MRRQYAFIAEGRSRSAPRRPAAPRPPRPAELTIIEPAPFTRPAEPRQQPSQVLKRQFIRQPEPKYRQPTNFWSSGHGKTQLVLAALAVMLFLSGLIISWQTVNVNHEATAQVSALTKKVDQSGSKASGPSGSLPSTAKPTSQAISDYVVAPNLPRYLIIPKINVYARVTQVGLTSTGALGAPDNVYDTAWYTGSAEPGQPGATLIDGHISSWTTEGVFYNLKNLVPGDNIEIVRGDGSVFNYRVVATKTYSASNVDMQAAISPIVAGHPGLNLISCTGQVEKGTSQFNERVIVFAEQI